MRTLLLADDNVTVQRVIALTFAQEPVRVVTASDGHQAMDRMAMERPDIVLAGTTLPHVNGYDLARFVRSKAELRNVPVLLLSGAFETVDEAQLKASGAAGVIEKPVEPTAVISRVKELLGLTAVGDNAAPAARRLVTPPAVATPAPPPARPRREINPAADGAGKGDALDALDSAFDTLDRQMAGGHPATPTAPQRNPAPPLRTGTATGDPRSPGKAPAPDRMADAGNPVYEVDEQWFGDSGARAFPNDDSRREIAGEPPAPEVPAPAPTTGTAPIYEVDDQWFAEDQKMREARELEQKQLAAEMGIHEVELPAAREHSRELRRDRLVQPMEPAEPVEPVRPVEPVEPVEPVKPVEEEYEPEPVARSLPIDWFAQSGPRQKPAPPPVADRSQDPPVAAPREAPIAEFESVRPMTSATPGRVADDFAALLAFEQGEHSRPPIIEPIIHAVTPEITPEMLEQIASTVADRLHDNVRVEPQAPEITGDMLEQIASTVAARLNDSIKVEPKAPEITGEMLKTMAFLVSGDVRNHIRIEPVAPVITPEMIYQISEMVATQLRDAIRVEPRAPEINEGMLQYIAGNVADRLRDTLRVEAKTPEINEDMLRFIAGVVADRLRDSVRVEPKAPEITDEMLGRIAENVAARLTDSIQVEPAIPELTAPMLDQIAGTVTSRLSDTVTNVADAIRNTVTETVRASAVPPQLTNEMLDHVAWSVADRVTNAMPTPPPPAAPIISEDMLNLVAARVAEQVQGNFSIDRIKDSITESVRDTVRTVVAETSERLVREEIERIKSKAQ